VVTARCASESHGRKRPLHPIVGPITLSSEALTLVGDPDQVLITYTAALGSESETALRLLGSVAEPARPAERQPATKPT
jgi:hypothetical protein